MSTSDLLVALVEVLLGAGILTPASALECLGRITSQYGKPTLPHASVPVFDYHLIDK